MALAKSLEVTERQETSGVRRSPPPVPVRLRVESAKWTELPRELIRDLRDRLTNDGRHGDFKDDGVSAGSLFRELIDDYNVGVESAHGWYAITVWALGSQYVGPIAWMLVRPEKRYVPTLRVGTYTDRHWRGRGVGRIMVQEALRLARALGFERLVASPWNARSNSFFASAGFDVIAKGGGGSMSGLAEIDVPNDLGPRPVYRCRAPEPTF